MPQQLEVISHADDWTGVSDRTTRRRLQNRLAQRTWRKKQHQTRHFDHQSNGHPNREPQDSNSIVVQLTRFVEEEFLPGRGCYLALPGSQPRLIQFVQQAYQDYMLASPRPAVLQTLVQINVLNALGRNAAALGITVASLCAEDTLSPFNHAGPRRPGDPALPPSLQPTALQVAVHHHPWIDLFPLPEMRDSFLRLCGSPAEDDLCVDLVDVEESDRKKPNLVVWGDHSDPRAWEATVPFLRKWGWVVRDCRVLLDSTNYWREKRGEKRLIFDV
ncbi:hypothetical protein EDB81DRAFT_845998 [Dactylonectria macrodidyma]|uniref:BZIP domain-containing protein n=1 Tax=Dactylonectria macrodidyma TaxID=307937 RepID=A0A9P9DZ34_9HYPO|nr:hypothetical protein EDB81DRAFT_845998 [Dactylonectria macrodidyma]